MRHVFQVVSATVLSVVFLFFASAYILPPTSDVAWVENLYAMKQWRVANMPEEGPRIFVVGGSEAHYSVFAEQIERETGIPAVNFGTHAGLGWDGHLMMVEPFLRDGDIVIYSANYYSVEEEGPSQLHSLFMRRNKPLSFFNRPVSEWPEYFGFAVFDQFLRAVPSAFSLRAANANGVKLNSYGDEAQYNVDKGDLLEPVKGNVQLVPYLSEAPFGIRKLKAYQNRWEWKGVKLYVYWMAAKDRPEFDTFEEKRKMRRFGLYAKAYGLPQLNEPYETLLSDEELANGPSHANSIGRERYTSILIERLKQKL